MENIIALCDVDPRQSAKVAKRNPGAKIYTDYRELLAGEKEVDAVLIATPDHTHAVITMACMKAGKHVYTQKPLTHNVWEARELARAAKEYGAIFKGSKGTIMCGCYGDSPRLIPESRMQSAARPPKTLPRLNLGHEQAWVRAIKRGQPGETAFTYSGPLTETCLLGNVAKRVDTRIAWNPVALRVPNHEAANKYIREPYRDGWNLIGIVH